MGGEEGSSGEVEGSSMVLNLLVSALPMAKARTHLMVSLKNAMCLLRTVLQHHTEDPIQDEFVKLYEELHELDAEELYSHVQMALNFSGESVGEGDELTSDPRCRITVAVQALVASTVHLHHIQDRSLREDVYCQNSGC